VRDEDAFITRSISAIAHELVIVRVRLPAESRILS
jgi:hypothetical protein